jgi:hypothetical protein
VRCQTRFCAHEAKVWIIKGGKAVKVCGKCCNFLVPEQGWELRDQELGKAPQG